VLSTVPARAAPGQARSLSVTTLPRVHPGRIVVEVVGQVDTSTAPVLALCLRSQSSRRGLRELVVALSQVSYLGAAGAMVLARAHRRCRLRGVRLLLRCHRRRSVLRPLQLTGLADEPATGSPPLRRGVGPAGSPGLGPEGPPATWSRDPRRSRCRCGR
jgi:anti-sigma B factor antagonist